MGEILFDGHKCDELPEDRLDEAGHAFMICAITAIRGCQRCTGKGAAIAGKGLADNERDRAIALR